jgi:hypothetical protein
MLWPSFEERRWYNRAECTTIIPETPVGWKRVFQGWDIIMALSSNCCSILDLSLAKKGNCTGWPNAVWETVSRVPKDVDIFVISDKDVIYATGR